MKIRKAETRDFSQILKLFQELDSKHQNSRWDVKKTISIERYKRAIAQAFESEKASLIVGEIESEVVGFAIGKIFTIKNNFVYIDQNVGEVLYIILKDDFKKKGLGKKMLRYIENELKEIGATKFELRVFNFNNEFIPEKHEYEKKLTIYEKHC